MKRWALIGAVLGALAALPLFAPATWLAAALASATDERLLLADARGTLWRGSAVLVLTGGPGSRDASALPGRVQWTLDLDGAALALRARHACCITEELKLRFAPGLGRVRIELPAPAAAAPLGHWPAAWLAGLGTPWNTLQPAGTLQLSSPGFSAQRVAGRWAFSGRLDMELQGFASSLSTLEELGSYRLSLQGDGQGPDGAAGATLQLSTLGGALQMRGSGQWLASRLRFNGEAQAAPGSEAALNNLLNIIGRRRGALSIISIG